MTETFRRIHITITTAFDKYALIIIVVCEVLFKISDLMLMHNEIMKTSYDFLANFFYEYYTLPTTLNFLIVKLLFLDFIYSNSSRKALGLFLFISIIWQAF